MPDSKAEKSPDPKDTAPKPESAPAPVGSPVSSPKEKSAASALAPEADKGNDNIAANEEAEQKALKEKMKGNQAAKNWTPPSGGETYMMAMAGKEASAAGKRLRNELKALKEQQAEKREARAESQAKVEKQTAATEKLNGLMQVLVKDTPVPNLEKLNKWKEANPGKDFNKTLLEAIGDYRDATGEKYQKPDKSGDTTQDPISKIEDKANQAMKHDKVLEELKEHEEFKNAFEKAEVFEKLDVPIMPK